MQTVSSMLNSATATHTKTRSTQRWFMPSWQRCLTGGFLSLATLLTAIDSPLLHLWERQVQTFFAESSGRQTAPDDIVILAIDDESLSQADHYRSDPDKYEALAPIQKWPWQREAYAIVIERLMEAGAKAVAVDVVLSTKSTYDLDGSQADDQALASVLEEYGDRVVLAANYQENLLRQGFILQPTLPIPQFQNTDAHIGIINFPVEPDGRIHRQGHTYLTGLKQDSTELDLGSQIAPDWDAINSFAEATLNAAQIPYAPTSGTDIQYLGPAQTFQHIPFWYVLDPDPWYNYLNSGSVFQDKIVLIGATAPLLRDFHEAPFSGTSRYPNPLPGVEILANDIATLRSGSALQQAIPSSTVRAGLVLLTGIAATFFLHRCKRTLCRLALTVGMGTGWLALSYLGFTGLGLILPTASIIAVVVVVGSSQTGASLVAEQIYKQRLHRKLAQYATSPIVREIMSQEEDFQDLLARQAQVVGSLLGGRYEVQRVLGTGGFSETYTALDSQRPGQPICVVKQLKIVSDDPRAHDLAYRLFAAEANTLEKLGHHPQIPRLLAHFETTSSFYLVEEMVHGITLKTELSSRQPKSQAWVMNFLLDILPIVQFVHSQGVIHRDIKPSNLIRRAGDGRIVLIDFGSVKQISDKLANADAQVTSTIGIGTKGYMPSEQSAGMPRFNSDLYAIGVTAIQALTGLSPFKMTYDDHGEIIWQYRVPDLNLSLANILNKMVRYDFSNRHESAAAVLTALREIPVTLPDSMVVSNQVIKTLDQTSDEDDLWDEPTGSLPTGWLTRPTEKINYVGQFSSDETTAADP